MYSPKKLDDLRTPAFIVDIKKVKSNCASMLHRCEEAGVKLRAQTKTHRTIEGARVQTGGSNRCLVTSTLSEVEFYADHGFDDILYGYPLTADKVERCVDINRRLSAFHVMIDSDHVIPALLNSKQKWSVYMKLDCGNNRAGVWWDSSDGINLARQLVDSEQFVFMGVYVHCGNSYGGVPVAQDTVYRLMHFTDRLKSEAGIICHDIGIGSTPTCSHDNTRLYSQLTELHPGNYIFYDSQQVSLGSCSHEDIACRVATRVIGHYPRRNQLLIDCGFTALSKQHKDVDTPELGYGVIACDHNLKILDMTQEIGKVTTYDGSGLEYDKYPVGTMLYIYPWHSCATAGLHQVYYIHDGDDMILEQWLPNKGW